MRKAGWGFLGLVALLNGCPAPEALPPDPPEPGRPMTPPLEHSPFLDPRVAGATVTLPDTPPAISGGTLAVGAGVGVIGDSDRDRVVVLDLVSTRIVEEAQLPPGAEPGRTVIDSRGRAHVALRGTGEVFSFRIGSADEGTRHLVCGMPRGIAYDEAADQLVVACRGGELVTLDAATGTEVRRLDLASDLRDVVLRDGRVLVSRFRTARLVEVDRVTGEELHETVLPPSASRGGVFREDGTFEPSVFEPAVAWRTISGTLEGDPDATIMVHQRESESEVQPEPGGYGSGSGCDSGIVQSSVSIVHSDGTISEPMEIAGATLPVDVAVSHDGTQIAVVAAANEGGSRAISVMSVTAVEEGFDGNCIHSPEIQMGDEAPVHNAVAVAFDDADRLVVFERDPAALVIVPRSGDVYGIGHRVDLGGESRFDTGHSIFHGNAGQFVACASCHPEGGEDGRTWSFGGIGPRRTPPMHGDLRGTEPFHWDGDMADLSHLVHEVFTSRMGGPALQPRHVDALGDWIDELPRPVLSPAVEPEAVARGRALYNGEAQCSSCHSGPNLTNSATVDVGTGGAFQVPSLIGIALRTPVMHSGCATTLRARFEPSCGGGDSHGRTSHLSSAQVDDLVAYLETL